MEKHSITPEYDYYTILGINSRATHAEIRRAFRTLALRCHPDQNPDDPQAGEKFKVITEAYKALINPKTRSTYDRVRNSTRMQRARANNSAFEPNAESKRAGSPRGRPSPSATQTPPPSDSGEKRPHKPWWEEEELHTPPPSPPPPPPETESMDGADIEADLSITPEVASFGSKQPLAVSRYESCLVCNGTGGKPGSTLRRCPECDPKQPSPSCNLCAGRGHLIEIACPSCFGRGRQRVTKTRIVSVPRRAQAGQKIRIPGEGIPGRGEGKPGDLVVRFLVKPRDEYEQRDSTVHSEVHIPPQLAAVGGVIRVKTVEGTADLIIPPKTKSDTVFRLEGKGPILQGKERSDHFVTVKIVVP